MNTTKSTTTPPTSTIARVVLSLVVALLLGTMLVDSVEATKKGKNTIGSVQSRVQRQRELCEQLSDPVGTLTVTKTAFQSTITKCTGGTHGGTTCVHTKKSTKCSYALTSPPDTGPAVPPTGGVEEPSGGSGSNNAGGGAAVPPGGGVEDPGSPPAGEPVLQ